MNKNRPPETGSKALERSGAPPPGDRYVLRLYVTGSSPRCIRAISNVRSICEAYLAGRYDLDVIDISRDPVLAEGEQIIAAPTLIKKLPLPLRRFIGDMSETDRILIGLNLRHLSRPGPLATDFDSPWA